MDDDGFIFLGYEADEMNDESKFLWSKNYAEPIDAGRARAETKKDRYGRSSATRTVRLYLFEICDSLHKQEVIFRRSHSSCEKNGQASHSVETPLNDPFPRLREACLSALAFTLSHTLIAWKTISSL